MDGLDHVIDCEVITELPLFLPLWSYMMYVFVGHNFRLYHTIYHFFLRIYIDLLTIAHTPLY